MIHANELRIGNWVNACYPNDDRINVQVLCISDYGERQFINFLPDGEEYFKANELVRVNPILLTEQWLIDFGINLGEWFDEDSFQVTNAIGLPDMFDFNHRNSLHTVEMTITYLKYVHQLQNLYFALTGTELELKKS